MGLEMQSLLCNFLGTKASTFVSCPMKWEADSSVFVERKLVGKQGGKDPILSHTKNSLRTLRNEM